MKPFRFGVIGCGSILREIYAPALQALPEISVVGLCDLNPAAAREMARAFPQAEIYSDARKMLRTAKLDAVMVLTSEKANAAMARLALEADVPVYLEKPPAISSLELEELLAAESRSSAKIYTAFNRRHTPLVAGLPLCGSREKIRRISGALLRQDRQVHSFPYTAIHLLDSAQYFGGSLFRDWKVTFTQADVSQWVIEGQLENGAACRLVFVPNGNEFAENLHLETETRRWELQFPNSAAAVPEGEAILWSREGELQAVRHGEPSMPFFKAMGFAASLQAFLRHLRGEANAAHRLSSCRPMIALMEEMLNAVPNERPTVHSER